MLNVSIEILIKKGYKNVTERWFPGKMTYTLEELPPLQERRMGHEMHMLDNIAGMRPESSYYLLCWNSNSFLMAVEEEMAWVSPPFENTGSLDVAPLGKELTTVFPIVNFVGYDINEISYLAESWLDDKWQALRRKFQEMRIKGDSRWDSLPEYAWLQNHDISPEYFTLRMEEPLTQFYGAARDDVLLAYVAISGNSSFQVWDERASIRMNSFSPQEFLDLQVARLFVELGVPLFERGVALPFMAIEYKQKFGPLTVVEEWNYEFRGIAN